MKPSADIPKVTSPPKETAPLMPTVGSGEDPHGFSFSNPAIAAEKTD